jgi:hypothetical protein
MDVSSKLHLGGLSWSGVVFERPDVHVGISNNEQSHDNQTVPRGAT